MSQSIKPEGSKVRVKELKNTEGMTVHSVYLYSRKAVGTEGLTDGIVPGHGGEVLFVRFFDVVACYSIDELELVDDDELIKESPTDRAPTKFETRIIKTLILPKGDPIFSERMTAIEIEDEAAGEYVKVTQDGEKVCFDPDEWPAVRAEIDRAIGECRGCD